MAGSFPVPQETLTKVINVFDPQVIADKVDIKTNHALMFGELAPTDTTLVGQAGDKLTFVSHSYSGAAKSVAEGEEIPIYQMAYSTQEVGVSEIGKAHAITDKAAAVANHDLLDEAAQQIALGMADRIDYDILNAALTQAEQKIDAKINLDLIDALESKFNDKQPSGLNILGTIILNPKDASKLRKLAASDWSRQSDLGDDILKRGVFGELLGWLIKRSTKLPEGQFIATKAGAMKRFIKIPTNVEMERRSLQRVTIISGYASYGVGVVDQARLIVSKGATAVEIPEGNIGDKKPPIQPEKPPVDSSETSPSGKKA